MPGCEGIWKKAFCEYTKDPRVLQEFVEYIEARGVEKAVEEASRLIVVDRLVPDAITLGFSPQVLIAAAASRLVKGFEPRIYVVTSPEVVEGKIPPSKQSHRVLTLFQEAGLVKKLLVSPMAPSPSTKPPLIIEKLTGLLRSLHSEGVEVLDVSGGTQLVPLAAVKAGIKALTYTYPEGDHVTVYTLEV